MTSLFRDSLSDLPETLLNADEETLKRVLTERILKVAQAETEKPNPRWKFTPTDGNLTLNFSTDVAGGSIEAGKINLYKSIGMVTVGILACRKHDNLENCVQAVIDAIINAFIGALTGDATKPEPNGPGVSATLAAGESPYQKSASPAWRAYAHIIGAAFMIAIGGIGLAFFITRRYRRTPVNSSADSGTRIGTQ